MALLSQPAGNRPADPRLSLEIQPWAAAASRPGVALELGEFAVDASEVVWTDVLYRVGEAPLFHTHTLFHTTLFFADFAAGAEEVCGGRSPKHTWSSLCPGALFELVREDAEGEEPTFKVTLTLNQSSFFDAGRSSEIILSVDRLRDRDVLAFAHQLDGEFAAVHRGESPPAQEQAGREPLAFARALNAQAYDAIGGAYHHDYLEIPLFRTAFDEWTALLPDQARVLDVGCGHGLPVMETLAARGHRVTGIDVSPTMLDLAARNVPSATLRRSSPADLREEAVYDGACSFFALTHLDPIDLRIALHRLHRALVPGSHLLLVAGLPDPAARHAPYVALMERPVWEWSYEPEEVIEALTTGGLFAVTSAAEVAAAGAEEQSGDSLTSLAYTILARRPAE